MDNPSHCLGFPAAAVEIDILRKVWEICPACLIVTDPEGRIERAMYNVRAKGHVAKLRGELGL